MVSVGMAAPLFHLADFALENRTSPVLLAFFKITCPTCQLTFPFLQRLADRGGLRIVGISQDDAAGTAEFTEAFGVRFHTVVDPAPDGYPVSNAYGLTHVPALVLVDPDGRITWTSEGFVKADLEALAAQWDVVPFFTESDRIPDFKPG